MREAQLILYSNAYASMWAPSQANWMDGRIHQSFNSDNHSPVIQQRSPFTSHSTAITRQYTAITSHQAFHSDHPLTVIKPQSSAARQHTAITRQYTTITSPGAEPSVEQQSSTATIINQRFGLDSHHPTGPSIMLSPRRPRLAAYDED